MQDFAAAIGHGPWAGHTPVSQMPHELQIKRKFFGREFFKDRENEPALGRVDKIIGVLNARGNALEANEFTKIKASK